MIATRVLAFLLLASCATSKPPPSPPEPAPAPAARTTSQPTQAPADTAQQPKIVQAQLLMGRPLVVPPEVIAPRTGALAPRTGVMAPETVGPAPLGKVPPLIIVQPPEVPEAAKEPPPPETTKPPLPVIVNPPKVDERETEEATRRKDRPPKPNEVRIADPKWQPTEPNAPRYLPCWHMGVGGSGASRPEKAPPEWIRCTYRCGRYEVRLYDVRPKIDEKTGKPKDAQAICEEWINLKRAEEHARSKDAALRDKGQ